MKCKNCGAILENEKCLYCGYKIDLKIFDLRIIGNHNTITLRLCDYINNYKYSIINNHNIINISINKDDFINIKIEGNYNTIKIPKKIKYYTNITGNHNNIKEY